MLFFALSFRPTDKGQNYYAIRLIINHFLKFQKGFWFEKSPHKAGHIFRLSGSVRRDVKSLLFRRAMVTNDWCIICT